MNRPHSLSRLTAALLLAALGAHAAEERTITIQEPFGLEWGPDLVAETVQFPEGAVAPDGVSLKDAAGQPVAVQLTDVELWPDGKSVKSARARFHVRLQPGQQARWTLTAGRSRVRQPDTGLTVKEARGALEVANAKTGVRLAGGAKAFAPAVPGDQIPAPLQAVRLPAAKPGAAGDWVGRGWWQTDLPCTGYKAEVLAAGPVLAQVRLRYDFEGGKHYAALVELAAEQDVAVFTEDYDLSDGKAYPMGGVDGMTPEGRYTYVLPRFDTPDKALMWDWWGQTMAVLPTPNAYCFSFYDGLKPDSADYAGRNNYGNLKQGDGGLTYEKDSRIAYLNAYLQWGDEEALYLGFWNTNQPARQLAFLGLRPSEWLHPDITPHPNVTLKQYVQTTCPTFHRRKSGDVFMSAPVCLGKRVYGVGGVERTFGRQDEPTRGGPVTTTNDVWGANLMLRHVRLGRLQLDDVRRWTLAYDEPSKYPRMFVPPGDRARYESRKTRQPLEDVQKELAARTQPTAAEQKAVETALERLRQMVRHFARGDYGHMDYGINEGLIGDLAEEALASPACTPEQNTELRRWLAALVYYALHRDFVPPREAGFAWGSANMMAQVQCRACGLAALLPNHPDGKRWRERLAHVVTLYVEDQINDAGATLECPHYGSMAVVMPVHALAALAHCGDVNLDRADRRLRAAARQRLACLLPPDVRGGFRAVMPSGDGYYEGDITFAPLAGFFATRDPALAAQLAWGVAESANQLGGHSDPSYKLLDPGLAPAQPALGSEAFPGYGFVMRNGFPRADEAYVQVLAGDFSWGHGHNDRGCWALYAKGAPLMVDFAAMYTPSMREQWMHPGGLTFNHDETPRAPGPGAKDEWWRKNPNYKDLTVAPFTVVEMRSDPRCTDPIETFGKVTTFQPGPAADYAVMQRRVSYLHRVPFGLQEPHGKDFFEDFSHEEVWLQKPFLWTRQFVFVKDADPAGHNYLVVRDDLGGNTELDPSFNLLCLAEKVDVQGQTVRYTGQHGVDLHSYVAEPATFAPATRTVGHPCGFGFAQHYKKTFGKAFREDQIQCRIPQAKRGGGFFVTMVPVKQGEPAPAFETILDGRAVRVTFPDRVDTVLLQTGDAECTIEGKTVKASAVLVTRKGEQVTVSPLAAP
jgi:hypothetical protein